MRRQLVLAVLVASFVVGLAEETHSEEHSEEHHDETHEDHEEGVEEITDPKELAELGLHSTGERHVPDGDEGGGAIIEHDLDLDEDGYDEHFIEDHMPDVDEGFAADPHGYNSDRDMLGFEDETVSEDAPEKVEAKFDEHFLSMDGNSDGFLDYDEIDKQLRSAMLQHFLHQEEHAKRHAQDLFKASDEDQDGKLTAKEFFNHLVSGLQVQ
jgi:hypothetical protein